MASKKKAKQAEAEAQPADAEAEEGQGGKKKLIIIAGAAVLLLLVVGGVAAFFFLGGEEPAAEVAEEGEPVEEEIVVTSGTYYTMEPEFIVALAPGSRFRALQTKIEVYSSDPDLLDTLKKHDPMLRHHLSNVFASKTSQELLNREGREQLKEEVRSEIEERLEKIGVRQARIEDLFFTQFVME